VEFAFASSVMFIFVLGLVEVGRALMVQHLLTNAARQGCRVATVPGKANSDITTAVNSALANQGVSGYSTAVQVNDVTANASTANSGDEITVKVSVPVGNISWVPTMRFLSGSLSGQYTLRRE